MGETAGDALLVAQVVVDADLGVIGVDGGGAAVVEVVAFGAGVAGLIGTGIVGDDITGHGVEAGGGDDASGEQIADGASAGRVGASGGGIEDVDALGGAGPSLAEVAGAFAIGGNGGEPLGEAAFAQPLIGRREEVAIADHRDACHAAELISLEAGERYTARIVEEVIRVEHGVVHKFIGAAMECIAA